jgi:hypothetical protein
MAALRLLNPGTLYPLEMRAVLVAWLALLLLLWAWLMMLPLLRVNLPGLVRLRRKWSRKILRL